MSPRMDQSGDADVVSLPRWLLALGDRGFRWALYFSAAGVAGMILFALGWRGSARTPYVPLQLPWLVSGGMVALAVVGTAAGTWSIHLLRRDASRQGLQMAALTKEAASVIGLLVARAQPSMKEQSPIEQSPTA